MNSDVRNHHPPSLNVISKKILKGNNRVTLPDPDADNLVRVIHFEHFGWGRECFHDTAYL